MTEAEAGGCSLSWVSMTPRPVRRPDISDHSTPMGLTLLTGSRASREQHLFLEWIVSPKRPGGTGT